MIYLIYYLLIPESDRRGVINMPRRQINTPSPETFSIWTSFTDLMSNAFIPHSAPLTVTIGYYGSKFRKKE